MLQRVFVILTCLFWFGSEAVAQTDLTPIKELIQNERLEEAKAELNKLIPTKPKNLDEVNYWLGIVNFQQNDFAAAQSSFQSALKAKGKSPYGHAGMGLLQLNEGNNDAANESLTDAMTFTKGKNTDAEFEIAKAYLTGGTAEIQQAKVILYQIRDKEPDLPLTYILLGDYYKAQGVPELAIEEFEKAKQKDPKYVPAYVSLAELYYEEKDYEKGAQNVSEAIKLDPNYGPAYRIRAELYLISTAPDKYARARNDMKKYVDLAQSDLKARIRYASFLFLTEDYEEMLAEIDAIEKEGESTRVMQRLRGMAYNELGQQDKAIKAMDTYFERSEEKYTIAQDFETYGDIMRAKGDLEKADEYYEKAMAKAEERGQDRSGLYQDIAEDYELEAKKIVAASKGIKKEGKAKLKEAAAQVAKYNELVAEAKRIAAENPEKAKELADQAKEVLAQANALKAESDAKNDEAAAKAEEASEFYPLEAHYRKKVVVQEQENDKKTLKSIYALAKAQYNAEMWEEADKSFIETNEMKVDYAAPYSYRMRVANVMEGMDTTKQDWYLKPVAEDIITAFGEKNPAEMSKTEKQLVLTAYEIMAQYNFNPTQEEGNYHCDDAKPFIEKIYAVDPSYARIQQLADFCEVQGGK
ncbi:MAG: hypothetical protein AAFQ87_01620 [Bacteroidota bacterium]